MTQELSRGWSKVPNKQREPERNEKNGDIAGEERQVFPLGHEVHVVV